jgi:Leucine-rich repeat (LRR) protein
VAGLLVAAATVLFQSVNYCRVRRLQEAAISAADAVQASYTLEDKSPLWLRKLIGEDAARLEEIISLTFYATKGSATEIDLVPFGRLNSVRRLVLHEGAEDHHVREIGTFHGLEELSLAQTQVTNEALPFIEPMGSLRKLSLCRTDVSDKGLVSVAKLRGLEELDLSRTKVVGSGFEFLQNPDGLRELMAADTEISDLAAEHIARIKSLKRLNLSRTRVTDAGVLHLAKLDGLKTLDLSGTRITDEGLRAIGRMTNLEVLSLNAVDVGDAGITLLADLPMLTSLSLQRTQVTDAAVDSLAKMTTLKNVWTMNTQITPNGKSRLRQALPQANVGY